MRWCASDVLLCLLLVGGCGPDKPSAPAVDMPRPRIGMVMIETAHRFESAGRAAEARRWQLAAYQAQELAELFEAEMTQALLPGSCDDEIVDQMYFALLEEHMPALKAAAEAEDAELFAVQFEATSVRCNGCHATCGVSFIQVPEAVGEAVPRMAPPPATGDFEAAAPPAPEPDAG